MVVGMHGAVGRVGLQVEGVHLDAVGMHVHRVCALREIYNTCRIGPKAVTRPVVIITVVARHGILVEKVGVHHVAERLSYRVNTVPHDAVADELLSVVAHLAAHEKSEVVALGVHITEFGVYVATAIVDGAGTSGIGNRGDSIII